VLPFLSSLVRERDEAVARAALDLLVHLARFMQVRPFRLWVERSGETYCGPFPPSLLSLSLSREGGGGGRERNETVVRAALGLLVHIARFMQVPGLVLKRVPRGCL